MSAKIVNAGLIGFGLSGRYFHAPFLTTIPNFKLKGVVERNRNDAQLFDPSIENHRTVDSLLDDQSIDVVFICTPNDTHYAYALKALEKGKHIVIEKPFANNEAEAAHIFDLAQKKGLIATAYQNRRWDSDFLTVQKIISEGRIGEIFEFESRYDRYRPIPVTGTWKEQGGIGSGNVYNLGPHLVDQALVLFGAPQTVTADIKTIRKGSQIDDYFSLKLGYTDKVVTLKSSLLIYQNTPRYLLHGTTGTFSKGGLDVQEETLRQDKLPVGEDWGLEPENRWGMLYSDAYTGPIKSELGNYTPFYQNVYDSIASGAEPLVKPKEVLLTTRVIDLAFKSETEQSVQHF
jgi:scyllo-inositol 2-dehydrogenase (NADP+)